MKPPEWLWLGGAIERAQAERGAVPEAERRALERARDAAELARRALEPTEPLPGGSGKWLAVVLYREALAWALRAEGVKGDTLAELVAAAPRELLRFAAGGEEALLELEALATGSSEPDESSESPELAATNARRLGAAASALVYRKLALERRLSLLVARRWLRVGVLAVLAVASIVAAALAVERLALGPDLASGRPWRASSREHQCYPEKRRCGGEKTRILFHTRREYEPWFEVDLEEPRTLSVVEIENRDACCPDRALPLVVELSSDRKRWREVAKRTETFYTWRAEFEPESARFVRVRVPRETTLHLVRVSVYAG